MDHIPDRENLQSMSRFDIQKLCKKYNIRANTRVDVMINALCNLVNEKNKPRPIRSVSERKAKDIQMHLGKDRPVIAGGSGAMKITKVISHSEELKDKTSTILQQDTILEEYEGLGSMAFATDHHLDNLNIAATSVRPLSPIIGAASGSLADHQATHPGSVPPHWFSTQPLAHEHLVPDSQMLALADRVAELETAMVFTPALKEYVKRLEDERRTLVSNVELCMQANADLAGQIKGLLVQNSTLREYITLLGTRSHDLVTAANCKESSMSNAIVPTSGPELLVTTLKALEKGKGVERLAFEVGKNIEKVETAETAETVMNQDKLMC